MAMTKVTVGTAFVLCVSVAGCGPTPTRPVDLAVEARGSTLHHVVDERPEAERSEGTLRRGYNRVRYYGDEQFRPAPLVLLDARIEQRFGARIQGHKLTVKHFLVTHATRTDPALGTAVAGAVGYSAGLLAENVGPSSVGCEIVGSINGKGVYIDWGLSRGTGSFEGDLAAVTHECVDAFLEKVSRRLN